MNRDYAANYRHLYMHHWWWRARERAVLRVLRERLRAGPSRSGSSTLAVATGCCSTNSREFGDVAGCGGLRRPDCSRDNPWRDRIHVGPFDETFRTTRAVQPDPDARCAGTSARSVCRAATREPIAGAGRIRAHPRAGVPGRLWTSHDDLNHHYTRYTQHGVCGRYCVQASLCAGKPAVHVLLDVSREAGHSREGAALPQHTPTSSACPSRPGQCGVLPPVPPRTATVSPPFTRLRHVDPGRRQTRRCDSTPRPATQVEDGCRASASKICSSDLRPRDRLGRGGGFDTPTLRARVSSVGGTVIRRLRPPWCHATCRWWRGLIGTRGRERARRCKTTGQHRGRPSVSSSGSRA